MKANQFELYPFLSLLFIYLCEENRSSTNYAQPTAICCDGLNLYAYRWLLLISSFENFALTNAKLVVGYEQKSRLTQGPTSPIFPTALCSVWIDDYIRNFEIFCLNKIPIFCKNHFIHFKDAQYFHEILHCAVQCNGGRKEIFVFLRYVVPCCPRFYMSTEIVAKSRLIESVGPSSHEKML